MKQLKRFLDLKDETVYTFPTIIQLPTDSNPDPKEVIYR